MARLWVDGPAPGDVMCPLGMSGRSKKVSDLLNEARIPVSERAGVPVVRTAPGGAVVWSQAFARTSVLNAWPQRAWRICFVWPMRNSVPRQLFCATLTVFPALMAYGLENIPRALLECEVRVHTAVCGR